MRALASVHRNVLVEHARPVQVGLEPCGERQSARYYAICPAAQHARAEAFLHSMAAMYEACGLGSVLPFPPCPRMPSGPVACAHGAMPDTDALHVPVAGPAPGGPPASAQRPTRTARSQQAGQVARAAVAEPAGLGRKGVAPGHTSGTMRSQGASDTEHSLLLLRSAAPGSRGPDGELIGSATATPAAMPGSQAAEARHMPSYGARPRGTPVEAGREPGADAPPALAGTAQEQSSAAASPTDSSQAHATSPERCVGRAGLLHTSSMRECALNGHGSFTDPHAIRLCMVRPGSLTLCPPPRRSR